DSTAKTQGVDIVQGGGIKRKLLADVEESETKRIMPSQGPGSWFVAKFTPPTNLKRYLEDQKARIGRMKPLKPRNAPPIDTTPPKRSHKRGASGTVKRGRPAQTRSPRVRPPV